MKNKRGPKRALKDKSTEVPPKKPNNSMESRQSTSDFSVPSFASPSCLKSTRIDNAAMESVSLGKQTHLKVVLHVIFFNVS